MDERIEIPFREVDPETLNALIEAFVLQEGTNYGDRDVSLSTMVDQVRKQLEKGQARLVFDPETDSCNLITERDWKVPRMG